MIVDGKRSQEDLIIISSKGQVIRLPIGSVNSSGRSTQGVRLMRFKGDSDVVSNVVLV
jgi:DNA gyrase/topoisomerase IV subunit A